MTMSRYDFRPSLVDHCQISVLVRSFNGIANEDISSVVERLSSFQFAKIQNSNNRIVRFKFYRGLQKRSQDWWKLQTHRRHFGLIIVARIGTNTTQLEKELDDINLKFINISSQYSPEVLESRCIILCSEVPSIQLSQNFIFLEDSDSGESSAFTIFMQDFTSSLFVVLESMRVKKYNEKFDAMELPTSPVEQEPASSDSDSRVPKRKILGRHRKLLADLYLLSGMFQEALYHYGNSAEYLRSVSDLLWMGAALEGLCSTSIIMTKVGVPPVIPMGVLKGTGNSTLLQGDLDPEDDKGKTYHPLTDSEIVSRYREALGCYAKFQIAHIEMEAHMKFTNLLISFKRPLEACEIIQRLMPLSLGCNEIEKAELYLVVSALFDRMNFKRKAAFFRRKAAFSRLSQQSLTESNFRSAISYLRRITGAFMLNLEATKRSENDSQIGWPLLQLTVLIDMFRISERLGEEINCIKLLCYILEFYSGILSEKQKGDLIEQLEECDVKVEKQEASNQPEKVGMIRPLPIVRNFKPRPLTNHLQPKKQEAESAHGGPFIFSSLSFQAKKKKAAKEVVWVCGDVAEVGMTVDNPLPAEIKVKHMILITEGIQFEAFPATLALPAQSGSFPFMLLGIPQTPGTLVIKGYKVDIFGIENVVTLDEPITVQVTPSLPLISLHCTLGTSSPQFHTNPDDEDYQTLYANFSTYRGHSTPTKLTIENSGKLAIKSLSIKKKKLTDNTIAFDEESVNSMLPLEPGTSADLDMVIMPEDSWKTQAFVESIKSSITLSYAAEDITDGGYGREIAFAVELTVMPSISVGNYEVYELKKHPSCCCVCFDLCNDASIAVNFEVYVHETKDIKPKNGCPCKTEILLPARKSKRIGVHFPRCFVEVPNLRMLQGSSNYDGVTFLENLKCTAEMVKVLKPRHLGMSIAINNNTLNEGEDVSASVCQMLNLHLQLTNDFDPNESNCLRDLNLSIRLHQGDDVELPSSQTLFTHCGTLTKTIKKLFPGEVLDHTCGLFFLFPGEYFVDVTCRINASPSRMSLKRGRAFAVIDENIGVDTTDGGFEEMHLMVDGTVGMVKRGSSGTKGTVLEKPSFSNWARRMAVHVA